VIAVQLVDDHTVVRSGFRRLLEDEQDIVVVAESGNGEQACRDFFLTEPDVLVMDISLPGIVVWKRQAASSDASPRQKF
jgi:two-component system invasion response regulator UvrY